MFFRVMFFHVWFARLVCKRGPSCLTVSLLGGTVSFLRSLVSFVVCFGSDRLRFLFLVSLASSGFSLLVSLSCVVFSSLLSLLPCLPPGLAHGWLFCLLLPSPRSALDLVDLSCFVWLLVWAREASCFCVPEEF